MDQRRRVWGLFVVLVGVALVLITLDFRTEDAGPVDAGRDAATAGLAPFERSLTFLVEPARRVNVTVRDYLRTRSENQRLRSENDALRERRASVIDLQREVTELRALLGVRDEAEWDTVAARVIAVSPSNFEWTLTIDAGSRDGIERGMAVVSADGLVGRVLQVTPYASRVLLAIDPNFSVAARTSSMAGLGVLDGRGTDPLRFTPLDPLADLLPGEELVTATFSGSAIPAGIPIGLVQQREAGASRLSSTFEVLPYVDMTRLDRVLVILRGPAATVPPFEDADEFDVVRPGTGLVQQGSG